MTPNDAINFMDEFFDGCMEMDLTTTVKFQCIKILRDALITEGFDEHNANILSCTIELEVSQLFLDDYRERVTSQLGKLAQLLFKLYFIVEEEFNMDVPAFVATFAKDISYKLEV